MLKSFESIANSRISLTYGFTFESTDILSNDAEWGHKGNGEYSW